MAKTYQLWTAAVGLEQSDLTQDKNITGDNKANGSLNATEVPNYMKT